MLTRRELTVAGAGLVVAAHVPDAWAARLLHRRAKPGPGRFLDGVASGDPSDTSMVFWSRLMTDQPLSGARLVVARDEGLTRTVATVVVPTDASVDGTLKVRVTGLEPQTTYWYAFQSTSGVSPVGRTKTLPAPDSDVPLRIGFSSCQKWDEGFFNGHADAAGEPLDLYLFLGDYTYEYGREPSGVPDRADRGASTDLRSYREKLRLYRTDVALRELHRLHPVAHVWDDHEVADNYTDHQPDPSPLQRNAGYKASFEWLPRLPAGGERFRLYRSYKLGRMAEVFMLDARQYRIEDDGRPPALLGRDQLDWLKAGLRASTARWKVVANPVMIAPLGAGGQAVNPDQWDGFESDRQEVLDVCAAVPDVMFVTGDIHTYFTARLLRDGGTSGPPVATEYVGGSISSSGLPALAGLTTTGIFAANPWITYANGTDHGWGRLELGADKTRITYRAAPLTTAGQPSRDLAVYEQAVGANDYQTVSQAPGELGDPTELPVPRSARELTAAAAPTRALARRRRKQDRMERDLAEAAVSKANREPASHR